MIQIVAGRNALRLSEWRVVSTHAWWTHPFERDIAARACWARSGRWDENCLRSSSADSTAVGSSVSYLAPQTLIVCGNGCWVDAEIEKRGVDGAAAVVAELRVDALPPRPIERRHQRAVEENVFRHGSASAAGSLAYC